MWLIGQFRSRVQYKIIVPFLLLAGCTAVLGSAVAFSFISMTWQERFVNQLASITRTANDILVEQETTNLIFLRQIAFASANSHTGAPAVSEALASNDRNGLLQALDPFARVGIADTNVQLDRLIVFDANGYALVDIEHTPDAATTYRTLPPRDLSGIWFVPGVLEGTVDQQDDKHAGLVTLPGSDGTRHIYLCTVVPIRADDQSPIVGGALLAVRLDTLVSLLHQRSQAAIVTIYDIHGVPLSSTALHSSTEASNTSFWADETPSGSVIEDLQIAETDLDILQTHASPTDLDDVPVVTTVTIGERDYEVFYTYLVIHNARVGILSTGMPSDYIARWGAETRPAILGLTLLVMLAIIVIGVVITRQITSPLEQLVATAGTFVAGGLKQDGNGMLLPGHADEPQDEIGVLSSSFKRLTENQRRLIRRVLKESSQRAAILESIPDGIAVCDSTEHIYSINPRMRSMLGLSGDDRPPASFQEIPLHQVTETIFGGHMTDLYTLHDLVVRVSKSPILVNNKTYIGDVYVFQDMTAEVNVDRAKTTFTATISHEMRTPLTVIHGNTQLLQQGLVGPLNEPQSQLISTIHQHSSNMSRVLANTILMAEIDTGALVFAPEPLNLNDIVSSVTQKLQRSFRARSLSLTLDLPEDMPTIYADSHLLASIIEQLVHNALTYTETGGITIQAVNAADAVQIRVSDTGCGIPPPLLDRVFERFVRGDGDDSNNRPDRGIGLGLPIVRHLVELHGGHVWMTSELEHGTTVTFTMPRAGVSTNLSNQDMPQDVQWLATPQNGTNGQQQNLRMLLAEQGQEVMLNLPALTTALYEVLHGETEALDTAKAALRAEKLLPELLLQARRKPPLGSTDTASSFQHLLLAMLPELHEQWRLRQRPIPPLLEWARQQFTAVLSADVAPLDALAFEGGLWQGHQQLGQSSRIAGLLDISSQLPLALWHEDDIRVHKTGPVWKRIQDMMQPDMLLLGHQETQIAAVLPWLTNLGVHVIIMSPQPGDYRVVRSIAKQDRMRDCVVQLGSSNGTGKQPLRLVEQFQQGTWYRCLTNTLDPTYLPAEQIIALARHTRQITTIFTTIHQMLRQEHHLPVCALADCSPQEIQTHVWSTWILYSTLIDLADRVAEQLHQPANVLDLPPVYRGLRAFCQEYEHGHLDELTSYLTARASQFGMPGQMTPEPHGYLSDQLHLPEHV